MYLFTGYEDNSKFVVLQNSNYFEGNLLEIVNVEVDKELAIVLIAIKYMFYYIKENLFKLISDADYLEMVNKLELSNFIFNVVTGIAGDL